MAPIRWIVALGLLAYAAAFFAGGAAIGGVIDAFNKPGWETLTVRWLFRPEIDAFVAELRTLWAALLDAFSLLLGPGASSVASLAGVIGATPPPFPGAWQPALALTLPLAWFAMRARAMGAKRIPSGPPARLDALSVVFSAAIVLLYAGASLYFLLGYAVGADDVFEKIDASLVRLRRYDAIVALWVHPLYVRDAEAWIRAFAQLSPSLQAAPGLALWSLLVRHAILRVARTLRLAAHYPFLYVAPEFQPQGRDPVF